MMNQTPLLPFDTDANVLTPQKTDATVLSAGFEYIGEAYTIADFESYVSTYNFGSVPPDYIVLHHTANPDASWAPLNSDPNIKWDRGEVGLSTEEIKAKRKRQLDNIMAYYRDSLGWTKGPHLFIDELFIWLFTPMYEVGIHAAQGNSYHDSGGNLHYSIGIEVIGYYEHVTWPSEIGRNVGMAVALIKRRLGTFGYIDGPWAGKIGAHRMYNKPSCPGAAIVPSYYMPVLETAWQELTGPTDPWAKWGTAYPLPPEQRPWAIPQTWLKNPWLGQCRSNETYTPDGLRSWRHFQNGWITYEKRVDSCTVESALAGVP